MPKRRDLQSILILGSGPIVIGQACEFDYSGVQACRALREEGYRIILVNSNPATIMTDVSLADATYIEPLHWQVLAQIIEAERPDALLPTMGGQTALNCALDLDRHGVLEQYNVEMIGANKKAIDKAEDRKLFAKAMQKIGLPMPQSAVANSLAQAHDIQASMGFPTIIRPSFTMGGSGGGIAYNKEEFVDICTRGLELSPTTEVLIEESIIGWKEFEMEVVRDHQDNCIIVCSIENVDPMGVHTGDSITVAPAQTLTDKEYQWMRDAAIAVLREIGVDTGGSNVQFAMSPTDGRLVVIEMNPRVSRSSALASKATGFPIANVAAKLAVGYTLPELRNAMTNNQTPISFEPAIDYVVTKIPRFNFEKFPEADARLTTQMKSVGEAMAIGRTFQESLQKAICSLENGVIGLHSVLPKDADTIELATTLRRELCTPSCDRLWYVADAFRIGYSLEKVYRLSGIDVWFLTQIQELVDIEQQISAMNLSDIDSTLMWQLKRKGFADAYLADLLHIDETDVRQHRQQLNVRPVYKRVDTCAAEFPTETACLYSTYEQYCEASPTTKPKIMVLGGGPNRIGQGIEFDYCCVHASLALQEAGFETIMVNCNPETVSTDYDISNRLYFEPLTLETILAIVDVEKPQGVIVHYGGQTPLKLANALEQHGVPIVGTTPDAIDCAEDRQRFQQLLQHLGLRQPANGTVRDVTAGIALANQIGYPLMVRPSYVLGGRAMEVVYNQDELSGYLLRAFHASPNAPVLLDQFLDNAIEVDIDAVCDGEDVIIGGIMEHIEQAGVHSGDSSCSLPPHSLSSSIQQQLCDQMIKMAKALQVVGLVNAQFAIQDNDVYVLEVNPRASRTVPFVSKAINLPLAKIAAKCKVGISLAKQGITQPVFPPYYSVKVPVFPFVKFPEVDTILGPEMKSTGEVMGIASNFGEAFAKGQLAIGFVIKPQGNVFISVRNRDKPHVVALARTLRDAGYTLLATRGTAAVLAEQGIECRVVNKVAEGRPHIVDMIKNDEVQFIINTTEDKQAIRDSASIRRSALQHRVAYTTTLAGAQAACIALAYRGQRPVNALQSLYQHQLETVDA